MKEINASDFKARCLAILDEVRETGLVVTVLKHGKPVAELRPAVQRKSESPFSGLKGSLRIMGDVVSPLLEENDLDLERDKL